MNPTVSHTHELLPSSYIIEQRQQCCQQCGRSHSFSSIWIKTRYAGPGNPHKLSPVLRPGDINWNVPIEYRKRPIEQTPFCHCCYSTVVLGHLRKPPQTTIVVTGAAAQTYNEATHVKGGYSVAPESPIAHKVAEPSPRKAREKRVYTVDDLL